MNCIRCSKKVFSMFHAICDECRTELARAILADGKVAGLVGERLSQFTQQSLKQILPLVIGDEKIQGGVSDAVQRLSEGVRCERTQIPLTEW